MGVLEGGLISPKDLGMMIYNVDSSAFLFWDGSGFKSFGDVFSLPSGGTMSGYLVGDNTWMDFNTSARGAISGTSPVLYNSTSGAITLDNSGVAAGTYGSGTEIPVVTVDTLGRVTLASTVAVPTSPWEVIGADVVRQTGNVGIGTNSLGFTFEVNGNVGLGNTEVAGTFDVTGGLTSLGALDVVGNMAIDGGVQWNDAAFATGSDGLLLSSGTGVMSN